MNNLILISLLILTSCGSGKEGNIVSGNQLLDTNAFVGEILKQRGLPKDGETVSYTMPGFHDLADGKECLYHVDSDITYNLNGNIVRLTNNKTAVPYKKNPLNCPSTIPNFQSYKTQEMTTEKFLEGTTNWLNKTLNPSEYCKKKKWCTSSRLINRTSVSYKGINSLFVKFEIKSKSGKTYTNKSWISKESLLQGILEYDISTKNGNRWLDYKTHLK